MFAGMACGVFDIISFYFVLKPPHDITPFSSSIWCKNEIPTKVLSLKISIWYKFFQTFYLSIHITSTQKVQETSVNMLTHTNQIKYDFFNGTENTEKLFLQDLEVETKYPKHIF